VPPWASVDGYRVPPTDANAMMKLLYPLFCLLVVAGLARFAQPQGGAPVAPAVPMDARSAWAYDLATRLGNPAPTSDTVALIVAWTEAEDRGEGAMLRHNPLNTTETGGAIQTINSDGVRGYATYEDGMAATIQTLRYDHPGYAQIVAGIQGNDTALILAGLYASPWGTDMRNVEQIWREGRARVSCPLDPCWQSGTGYQEGHPGVDLGATLNQPVYATMGGIAHPSTTWPCGNGVMVTEGARQTLMCHLNGFAVGDGDSVEAGEVLGYAGATGEAYGIHVHYEVRVNGVNVEPL
jgi:murein DD-endopeptidase MepM/ murein hydrolase activator NlpD